MGAIPQTSPLKKTGGGSRTVVVTTGTSTTGGVPAHQHDVAAVISGRFPDARLRTGLASLTPLVTDLNAVLDTGWYSANTLTSNTPAASFWNIQNIFYGADTTTGYFVTQFAYEIVPTFRMYRRTLNVSTWSAWERIDVTGTRQVYEVAMCLVTAATAPAAVSATTNTELFSAAKMTRNRLDLSNATQVRLVGMVIANGNAAGASVKLSYMVTEAATWAGTDAGASIVLGTGIAGTLRDSSWQTLAVGARVDNVTVAALVDGAFSTTAPTIGSLTMFVR